MSNWTSWDKHEFYKLFNEFLAILWAFAMVKRATVLPGIEGKDDESITKTFDKPSTSPEGLQNGFSKYFEEKGIVPP